MKDRADAVRVPLISPLHTMCVHTSTSPSASTFHSSSEPSPAIQGMHLEQASAREFTPSAPPTSTNDCWKLVYTYPPPSPSGGRLGGMYPTLSSKGLQWD